MNMHYTTPSDKEFSEYQDLAMALINVFKEANANPHQATRALEMVSAMVLERIADLCDEDPLSYTDAFAINVRTYILNIQTNKRKDQS